MKIAIFTDCYLDLTGGIRSSITAQKAALEHNGHTVYLFSTGFPRSQAALRRLATQNIFLVPSCRLFFRGLTPVSRRPPIIIKWLQKSYPEIKDFDIFYIHYEAGCSIAGLLLGKQCHIPTVQVMHGREDMGETNIIPRGLRTIVATALNRLHAKYIPHRTSVPRDDYLANTTAKAKMWTMMVNHANYADLVLTPSEHFLKKLQHYGVRKEIKVFPNGFPDQDYPSNLPKKALKLGQELKIIWHSRVSGEKRIMPFLHALKDLQQKYRLDVYGTGGDYKKAKRYTKRHHMNVKFHGNVPFAELTQAIQDAHLDVLVSYDFDTFGMTLIEAEAYGTPVFFCDPDMQEVVPPSSFVMSKNETPKAMAEALVDLLEHPERIGKMSEVMLSHRSEVLISHRIKKLERIFDDIMKT